MGKGLCTKEQRKVTRQNSLMELKCKLHSERLRLAQTQTGNPVAARQQYKQQHAQSPV